MQDKVIFRIGQDVEPDDFNNLQDYVQIAFDRLVQDSISGGRGFAGFAAEQNGTNKVICQPGRFYSAGQAFARASAVEFDFTTSLPATGGRNVIVVVTGAEQDTDATQRDYLIDEATMATEPRTEPMRRARAATINTVLGTEAPDPSDPTFDGAYLAVARIVLSPTGVSSVTMLTENGIPNLAQLQQQLADLLTTVNADRSKLTAIDSSVASLAEQVSGTITEDAWSRVQQRLGTLEASFGVPANAVASGVDYFLDTAGSDTANPAFSARVMEGIRFPADVGATESKALALANPLNADVKITSGLMLPAYTSVQRTYSGSGSSSELQLSSYSYFNHKFTRRGVARQRIRYGDLYTIGVNAGMWGAASKAYLPNTFRRDGDIFNPVAGDWTGPGQNWTRATQYWRDAYGTPYWDAITTDIVVPGFQVGQIFLNANDMWLTDVSLYFSRLAAEGNGTLIICETTRGQPDPTKVISVTAVDRAAMKLRSETRITIEPCFLQAGQRYALVFVTAADHWLYRSTSTSTQGSLFYVYNGAYVQNEEGRDLRFRLYAAQFKKTRVVVDLQPLELLGGIGAIDINADAIEPGSCSIDFEVQINGLWYPLGRIAALLSAGGNLPGYLPLRAILTGTSDVAPALGIAASLRTVSRPAASFIHISTVRNLPAASTQIRVTETLESFGGAYHSCTAKLLTGADYATSTAASSSLDKVNADGSIERTWIFNLGAGVTSYKIRTEGTTTSPLRPFQVSQRKDWAL
jgi:hypothetical protein